MITGQSKIISENSSKKRGRPPLLDDDRLALVKYASNAHSLRYKQDVYYRQRALGILLGDPRFSWLCDAGRMSAGLANAWRPTILSALGRIQDDESLRRAALAICEARPKARDGVRMVRQWRLNRSKPGDALQLSNEIIRAINSYLARYPSTTWLQVEQAMHTARMQVEEAAEK
jgi:hypothetical protein